MVDFTLLCDAVKSAARQAFTDLRETHANETFYAYALYSDDGAMTIEPAANSEEGLLRVAEEIGESPAALRWATSEWPCEAEGGDHFQSAYDLLNIPNRYDDRHDEDTEESGAFAAFREQVFKTMADALAALDAEGFFGTGDARNTVTVFCTVSDSDDAERIENESARRLNPPAVYERFAARKTVA